jgi:hypothetical protein
VVDAMSVRVRAKEEGRIGPEERLVVIRPVGESRIDYALSNAGPEVPWPKWFASSGNGTGSRRYSRPARTRSGSITTRSGVGSAGIATHNASVFTDHRSFGSATKNPHLRMIYFEAPCLGEVNATGCETTPRFDRALSLLNRFRSPASAQMTHRH